MLICSSRFPVCGHKRPSRLGAAGYRLRRRDPLIRVEDAEFIQLFYVPPGAVLEVQIDLLLAESTFHRQAVERRVTVPNSELGFSIDVVSCEDLIVLELVAGRILDRVDAGELLKANFDTLELDYLQGWVAKLHLERAFAEAGNDVFPDKPLPA